MNFFIFCFFKTSTKITLFFVPINAIDSFIKVIQLCKEFLKPFNEPNKLQSKFLYSQNLRYPSKEIVNILVFGSS